MGAVDSCICPHCNTTIKKGLLDSMAIRAIGPEGNLHLVICPNCNKPLGVVATPAS